MKSRHIFLILCFSLLWLSCQKEEGTSTPPEGTWVEITQKTDTMVFDFPNKMMLLNRGKELRSGYLLPKYSSGPYFFELTKDSISLRWMASSSMIMNRYPFKIETAKKQLMIGNFFMEGVDKKATLTFMKIK